MKRLIIISAIGVLATVTNGQDIHFSQFDKAPLQLNPAMAGVYQGAQRVFLNYRSQWVGVGANYRTIAASIDMPVLKSSQMNSSFMGIGASFYTDKAGDSNFGTTQFALAASGVVHLNEFQKLSVGLQGGLAQRSVNLDNLQWGNQYANGQYDPSVPSQEYSSLNSFMSADVATGVFYQFLNNEGSFTDQDIVQLDLGVALFHANKPKYHFFADQDEALNRRWTGYAHFRYDFPGSNWSVQPSAIYHLQGGQQELNAGTLMRCKLKGGAHLSGLHTEAALAFGCYYRVKDAIVPQVQLELGEFGIGVSYDINNSGFSEVTNYQGGYEISLRYRNFNEAMFKRR